MSVLANTEPAAARNGVVSPAPAVREAILYLPSLGLAGDGADVVARHLADALSGCGATRYTAKEIPAAEGSGAVAPGAPARRPSSSRRFAIDPDACGEVAYDLYEVDYRLKLLERYQHMSIVEKVLRVAMESVWLARALVAAAVVAYRKTFWQRIQLVVVAAALLSLLVYFAMLLEALDAAVAHLLHSGSSSSSWFLSALHASHAWTLAHWHRVTPAPFSQAQRLALDRAGWAAALVLAVCVVLRQAYVLPGFGRVRHAGRVAGGTLGAPFASLAIPVGLRAWLLPFLAALGVLVFDTARNCGTLAGGACDAKRVVALVMPAVPYLDFASRAAARTLYHALDWSATNAAVLAAVLTAIGLSGKRLASGFESAVTTILAVVEYARIGYARSDATGIFTGALADVVRHAVRDDGAPAYARVHVMGYSFGAMVALDALFYARGTGVDLHALGDLITIGPPISLAKQLAPGHFSAIVQGFTNPEEHQWINVCSPLDIFGSPVLDAPFVPEDLPPLDGSSTWASRLRTSIRRQRADAAREPGDPNNIRFGRTKNVDFTGWYPLDLSMPEVLSLAALQAHEFYWSDSLEPQYTAFTRIAPLLREGARMRRAQAGGATIDWPLIRVSTPHVRDGDPTPGCTFGFPDAPWSRELPPGEPRHAPRAMRVRLAYEFPSGDPACHPATLTLRQTVLFPPGVLRTRGNGAGVGSHVYGEAGGWSVVELSANASVAVPPEPAARVLEFELWPLGRGCPVHSKAPILHYHRLELSADVYRSDAGTTPGKGAFTIECRAAECVNALVAAP